MWRNKVQRHSQSLTAGLALLVTIACTTIPNPTPPDTDTTRHGIARLNADGSLDESFKPSPGANYIVGPVLSLPDGKVMIGGTFSQVNGVPRRGLARLNADGSLDESFDPGSGIADLEQGEAWVGPMTLLADGKLLIGGHFTHIGGTQQYNIARLNADGSLDESFQANARHGAVATIALQPDGKIVIVGVFTEVNGVPLNRVARLHPDGSLDETFDPGEGADFTVGGVALQPDGKLVLGGFFSNVGGVKRPSMARVYPDGSLDESFHPKIASADPEVWTGVFTVALQADGKILLGGTFGRVGGLQRPYIARLNSDGNVDESFAADVNDGVHGILVQEDGKLLIVGGFSAIEGERYPFIGRLNPDGSLDRSFNPGAGANDVIHTVVLQRDGKLLIGGRFTMVGM